MGSDYSQLTLLVAPTLLVYKLRILSSGSLEATCLSCDWRGDRKDLPP